MSKPLGPLCLIPIARPARRTRFVRELLEFDGPLLYHYRDAVGHDYLYYCYDCDAVLTRWFVLRVSPAALREVQQSLDNLRRWWRRCPDPYVLVLDSNANRPHQWYLLLAQDIPKELFAQEPTL